MPQYDYRCTSCNHHFSVHYKSYGLFDKSTPQCLACGSEALSRLIKNVAIPKSGRDYGAMSSREMLSVLESGDEKQVGEMYRQVGGAAAAGTRNDKEDAP